MQSDSASYLTPRRRGSILTKSRPSTSHHPPSSFPSLGLSRPFSFRLSYNPTSADNVLDWQSYAANLEQSSAVVEDLPDITTLSTTDIAITRPTWRHSRRPSSLAESLKSGFSNVRSLSRRVSSSIRGRNRGHEETTSTTPPRPLFTRRSNPNLLHLSQSFSIRPKSRGLQVFKEDAADGTPYQPSSRGWLGKRKSSMPVLSCEPPPQLQKPEHTVEPPRTGYDRRLTILPDYVAGGAGARASAAAQNEALHLARSTPLPPYAPAATSSSDDAELRDSESGIGINLENMDRQDSRSAHVVVRVDPADVLATELLEHLLSFLDAKSLLQLELVSKKWKELALSPAVWRRVFYREYASNRSARITTGPSTAGLGKNTAGQDFRKLYSVRKLIERRWANGEAAAIYLNGHKDSVYCVQFDENKIITGSRDNTIRIWDARTYQCIRKLAPPNNSRERNQLLRPDVEPHGVVPFFKMDASSIEPKSAALPMWHQASVLCLQYDDEILVTGSSDFSCIVWDVNNDYEPMFKLVGHTAGVLDVCVDSKRIVTCSKDTTIKIWDRATGTLLKTLNGHRGPVNAVQVRGNLLASASGDGMSKLWRMDDGMCIKEFHSKERGLACVEFSEDGRTIFAGGNDHVIYEYDTTTGNIKRELAGHKDLVRSLHLDSPNGRIISGSYDHSIKVWDAGAGQNHADGGLKINLEGWTSSWMLAAKSNYRKIACASQDGRVVIVDFGFGINGVELVEA